MNTSHDKLSSSISLRQLPSKGTELAACTIIAKNYLPMARVLADSFQVHNPGFPFFVLLIDRAEGYFRKEDETFDILETRELQIPNLDSLLFKYNVLETSTAVKPYLLAHLFEHFAVKKLLYLDPDILILRRLAPLSELLDHYSVVLTPHITCPFPDSFKPNDHDILQAGSFNLGFVGLQNTSATRELLAWWQRKVYHHGLVSFEQNMFVDQRWMDMAPGLFPDLCILRDPGYNVAYWNFHERRVEIRDEEVYVNGGPCYFFHFSGFNPEDMSVVSKHQTRFKMSQLGDARRLFERYRRLVLEKGWKETKNWPYTYDYFDKGVPIPYSARRFYWGLGEDVQDLGNPFTWMDGDGSSGQEQDQQLATPKRDFPFGINVVGYAASEKGVGEAVRSNLRIIKATKIPYVANNFEDTGSKNIESLPENFSRENPYSINLINVNADQTPYFAERNPGYLHGHCNIGYWAWELCSFPPEWSGSFTYLDEVWVPSTFVRDSVAAASPIPVTCIPHSIDPDLKPTPEWNRERFGLDPDVFIYLFFFDFHSFLERKNPIGLIRAFKQAFAGRTDVLLLIKSTHALSQPGALRVLQRESRGANIRIFDQVLSRLATHSLMSSADCYISLHRSEGFGLTIAEAMHCGKPVIATAYSGNVDFMNDKNSFLVPFRLIEIEKDYGPYKKGYVWADPDLHQASQLLLKVFEDRELASAVAAQGQAYVMNHLHPLSIAESVKQRLGSLTLSSPGAYAAG